MEAGYNTSLMERAGRSVGDFVLAAGIQVLADIVDITTSGPAGFGLAPIDTGELRSSPRVTKGRPSRATTSPKGPYQMQKPSDVKRAITKAAPKPGDKLFLRYVADHAEILENIRVSTQAPNGFLNIAIKGSVIRLESWTYRGGKK